MHFSRDRHLFIMVRLSLSRFAATEIGRAQVLARTPTSGAVHIRYEKFRRLCAPVSTGSDLHSTGPPARGVLLPRNRFNSSKQKLHLYPHTPDSAVRKILVQEARRQASLRAHGISSVAAHLIGRRYELRM